MKARIILFALVASIATTMATAQNEQARMKQIREAYAGRLALMQDRPYDDGAPFNEVTTTVTNNLPGSGICTSNKHFYFTQPDFMESEDEEGEFDATLYSTLYYATSINVYAGTHHYIWEFLWDAETGDPMFAMLVMKEGSEKGEGVQSGPRRCLVARPRAGFSRALLQRPRHRARNNGQAVHHSGRTA